MIDSARFWIHGAITLAVLWMLATAFGKSESRARAKKIEALFAGRPALTPEHFYEAHYREAGIPFSVVDGIRAILEEQLDADMSRLRSSDDFSKNLSFFWDYDSMANVEILCAIEEKFAIRISDEEAEKLKTVDDIIHFVHAALPRESSPASSGLLHRLPSIKRVRPPGT